MPSAAPTIENSVKLGEPVPWFETRTLGGFPLFLGTTGGHWVVLCFFSGLSPAQTDETRAAFLAETDLYRFGHMAFFGILAEPPPDAEELIKIGQATLGFVPDYDGAIARSFGAAHSPRVVVCDPMLNAVANFSLGEGGVPLEKIRQFLRILPPVDQFAGVPLTAPVLIAPRILEEAACDFLIDLYQKHGGEESGVLQGRDRSASVISHDHKRRRDYTIADPGVRDFIRQRIVSRLVPAIARFFQYEPTRMDRYIVSCYDAESGGYFSRHRDTTTAGARHRRFAVSINLNMDYDGCDLVFPEFGTRHYRAPYGGAIVFSANILHEVTPVARGRRYAFLPFLYGEEDARMRTVNNALLEKGEEHYNYESGLDELFPGAEQTRKSA